VAESGDPSYKRDVTSSVIVLLLATFGWTAVTALYSR
jgi:hypothetical protein